MAVVGKSSTQKLFERNLLVLRINSETPKFWDIEALLDSLARLVITDSTSLQNYEFMLMRFARNEISLMDLQNNVRTLLDLCPYPFPREYFAGFLVLPLKTKSQETAARNYVCALVGLPSGF